MQSGTVENIPTSSASSVCPIDPSLAQSKHKVSNKKPKSKVAAPALESSTEASSQKSIISKKKPRPKMKELTVVSSKNETASSSNDSALPTPTPVQLKKSKKRVTGKSTIQREPIVPASKLTASAAVFTPRILTKSNSPTLTSKKAAPSVQCLVCTNDIVYAAIGSCDHAICSECALRQRVKNKSKDCVVCKKTLDFMLVYDMSEYSTEQPTFQSFNVEHDDVPIPGIRRDVVSSLLFVNCKAHQEQMERLRSLHCTFGNCHERFANESQLLKHLKNAHKRTLCRLCVINTALFISEHPLMTTLEYNQHMNGAPSGTRTSTTASVLTVAAGLHPKCRFCNEYQYDAHALYVHMQKEHCTCPVCPKEFQFRYYRNVTSLYEHYNSDHHTCSHCVGIVFRSAAELHNHIMKAHGGIASQHTGRQSLQATMFSQRQALPLGGDDSVRLAGHSSLSMVDLDMSLPNPNIQRAHQYDNINANAQNRDMDLIRSAADMPEHMRVVGRVSGAGIFQEETEDAEQWESLQMHAAEERKHKHKGGANTLYASHYPSLGGSSSAPAQPAPTFSSKAGGSTASKGHYPELPWTDQPNTTADTTPTSKYANLHPLSLQAQMSTQKKKEALEHQQQKKMAEDRAERTRLRNMVS